MINLEIQTLHALNAMPVNTVQQVRPTADTSVQLVIGALVVPVKTTSPAMHVWLVLIQREKEPLQVLVAIARKDTTVQRRGRQHRCHVRLEHFNRPRVVKHVNNVLLEWRVQHPDFHSPIIFVIMVITVQKVQITRTVGEPFPIGSWVIDDLQLLAQLENILNLQTSYKILTASTVH